MTGLTDDEVSPLHDHDADKEGRLARELQHLPLLIGLGKVGRGEPSASGGIQLCLKGGCFLLPSQTPRLN